MKADQIILQEQDKLNVVAEIPIKREQVIGNTTMFKGHTMYEINCTTGEITEAEFKEERAEIVPVYDINFGQQIGTTTKKVKDILTKENCLYISCLNKKSALKKYIKWLHQKLTKK